MHAGGDQVFFQDELDAVSQRLQQAEGADACGSPAVLYAGHQLALEQSGIGHARKHDEHDQHDLDDSSENENFYVHDFGYGDALSCVTQNLLFRDLLLQRYRVFGI